MLGVWWEGQHSHVLVEGTTSVSGLGKGKCSKCAHSKRVFLALQRTDSTCYIHFFIFFKGFLMPCLFFIPFYHFCSPAR